LPTPGLDETLLRVCRFLRVFHALTVTLFNILVTRKTHKTTITKQHYIGANEEKQRLHWLYVAMFTVYMTLDNFGINLSIRVGMNLTW